MPGFLFPGRPGGEHDEPLLDMIIARRALPPDAPQPMHDLAQMLAALAGPAEPGELTGEAAVRAAFSRTATRAGVSPAARRPVRHRRPRRSRGPVRSRVRLATVMVAAAVGLGSVLAAYIDVLPSPIQQLAHEVGAPAPRGSGPHGTGTLATAQPASGQTPSPSSQSAPQPGHSGGTTQAPSHGSTPTPHYSPRSSASGRHPTGPACSPASLHLSSPRPTGSAHASFSGSPPIQCVGIPTNPASEPTLNPYVPR
jgi:hypothetical protein